MEEFTKNEFIELLQSQSSEPLCEIQKKLIFGSSDRIGNQFHFKQEEKNLIKQIKTHFCLIDGLSSAQRALNNCHLDDDNKDYHNEISLQETCPRSEQPKTQAQEILNLFLETANSNAYRKSGGYRFTEEVKWFASYFRILSGPLAYECIQRNLTGALPSLSSTNRYIHKSHHRVSEGVLRDDELLLFLESRGLPLYVSLSEDATRIEGKIQYDHFNNQLIGFVLPTNRETGMPIPFVYKARSAEEIVGHFLSAKIAHSVNTVMVQPIGNATPFCLLVYGTGGSYNAVDVSKRWEYITHRLKKLNITVINVSSDSDPKYNKAMRMNSALGLPSKSCTYVDWFSCGNCIDPPFHTQDVPHIATKGRNHLLKTLFTPEKLPFGKYFIQAGHLKELIEKYPKDLHRLTATTVNPKDRQNYDSVLRICHPTVIGMLKDHVKKSDGTAMFLSIIRAFNDAFMDVKLRPIERVEKLWYALFIVRIWRQFVLKKKLLTLKKNFISIYLYTCLEQNAHSLLLIIMFLRQKNLSHLFQPWLFNSQACEGFYRLIRSLTSTFSTVANCDVKGILERINKIQLLNDISNMKSVFMFPQKLKSNAHPDSGEPIILPSHNEIVETIEQCKSKAISDAVKLGLIEYNSNVDLKCKVTPTDHTHKCVEKKLKIVRKPVATSYGKTFSITLSQLITVTFKNYAHKFINKPIENNSSYVEIHGGQKKLVVRKTSLVWLLRNETQKLSSDRLQRVMTTAKIKSKSSICKTKNNKTIVKTILKRKSKY